MKERPMNLTNIKVIEADLLTQYDNANRDLHVYIIMKTMERRLEGNHEPLTQGEGVQDLIALQEKVLTIRNQIAKKLISES